MSAGMKVNLSSTLILTLLFKVNVKRAWQFNQYEPYSLSKISLPTKSVRPCIVNITMLKIK